MTKDITGTVHVESSHVDFKVTLTMDARYCAQNVLLCDLCEIEVVNGHCELCQINLCNSCLGKHLSDSSNRHRIVPYKEKSSLNFPKCTDHAGKLCELFCEECDVPVCTTCLSSDEHHGHKLADILKILHSKKDILEKDLKELKNTLHPKYKDILSDVKAEKVKLEKHFRKLKTNVTKQGEEWHKQIDEVVKKRLSEIDEMKSKGLAVLNRQEHHITQIITDMKQIISEMRNTIMDSEYVFHACTYKSRNPEFKMLPPKIQISRPSFSHQKINITDLCQLFGSLSEMTFTHLELGYKIKTPVTVSSTSLKPLLDEPELITTIDTGYKSLNSVACLSDEKIWTCGEHNTIKLYSLQGKLLKSIKTKSESTPRDITVTRSGDLVYADYYDRTINIVKNEQIHEVIKLNEMVPYNVSSTSSGDLLVPLVKEDYRDSKVVRYSGSKEKQTFTGHYSVEYVDGLGYSHYDWHLTSKYICENRNLDICMADTAACQVTVVDQAGELRFHYRGQHSHPWEFRPVGIATDSQGQILTGESCKIHILDQNGQFLCHIDNCGLQDPWGLCVDSKDNLFVVESLTGRIKKIKYM